VKYLIQVSSFLGIARCKDINTTSTWMSIRPSSTAHLNTPIKFW
jgi:hypothetical protein